MRLPISYVFAAVTVVGAIAAMASVNGGSIETSCPTCSPIPDATFTSYVYSSNLTGTCSGTNTGDQTITLTGDVIGSGTGSFATTIATNSVALATDTTGSYVATVAAGTNISVDGSGAENAAVTVNTTLTPGFTTVKLSISSSLGACDATTEGTLKYYNHSGSGKKTLCVCGYEGLVSNVYGWVSTTPNGNCS